jgi:hypothetical protein
MAWLMLGLPDNSRPKPRLKGSHQVLKSKKKPNYVLRGAEKLAG